MKNIAGWIVIASGVLASASICRTVATWSNDHVVAIVRQPQPREPLVWTAQMMERTRGTKEKCFTIMTDWPDRKRRMSVAVWILCDEAGVPKGQSEIVVSDSIREMERLLSVRESIGTGRWR